MRETGTPVVERRTVYPSVDDEFGVLGGKLQHAVESTLAEEMEEERGEAADEEPAVRVPEAAMQPGQPGDHTAGDELGSPQVDHDHAPFLDQPVEPPAQLVQLGLVEQALQSLQDDHPHAPDLPQVQLGGLTPGLDSLSSHDTPSCIRVD
jgi:hypothetical protein